MRERILRALNTKDLSDEEWENAAHLVASLGAAQIGKRKQLSLGAMLLRVKAGQSQFIPRVVELLEATVRIRARRDRWAGITPERASRLVKMALEHHMAPLCPICHGVGKLGELGQVIVLCSRGNGGCGGTGKRDPRWKGWQERVKDVLGMLDMYEAYAVGGTRKQAGRESP